MFVKHAPASKFNYNVVAVFLKNRESIKYCFVVLKKRLFI